VAYTNVRIEICLAQRYATPMGITKAHVALFAAVAVVDVCFSCFLISHALQPQISIQLGDPLQPSNILSSPVILLNHGIFPIYDISVTCTGPGKIIETDSMTVFPAVSRLHGTTEIKRLDGGRVVVAFDVCRAPKMDHPLQVEAVVRVSFKSRFVPVTHRDFSVASIANIAGESRLTLLGATIKN
jgi:hypothetical protein